MHCHVHDERQELAGNPAETGDVLRLRPLPPADRRIPPTAKPRPILASYDGATELECGLGILLCRTGHYPDPSDDVMPPHPVRPLGHSSADGI
jgi:hypothetical protein